MFLIFGLRTRAYPIGLVAYACGVCGTHGKALLVKEVTKFSLFFIPLIPIRTRHVLECNTCRSRVKAPRPESLSVERFG